MDRFLGLAILVALVLVVLIARSRDTRPSITDAPGRNATVAELMAAGRKIDAIKLYRAQHGVGLKEAKDAVEALALGVPAQR